VNLRRTLLAIGGPAVVAVLSPPVAASTIRSDGLVDVDGRAFFPIGLLDLGWREYESWNKHIRLSGANCVWDVEVAYGGTTIPCSALMDSARAADYRLLIGSPDTINWDDPETPFPEVDNPIYDPERLDLLLRCAADEPSRILGFTNRDEPVWTLALDLLGDIDGQHIHDTYRQIHEQVRETFVAVNFAPTHLSADFAAWKDDLEFFLPATDVVMHAAYPYPPGPETCIRENVLGWPDCSLDRLADNADIFRLQISRPGQPFWSIVQAFKAIPRREARWAAWTSVVHGATGIFWAGWTWVHPLGDGPDIWPQMREVIHEVADLHDFLIGRDATPVVSSDPDVEMRALAHIGGEEIIAIAVSRHGFSGEVEMQLPLALPGEIEVVAEDRSLSLSGGRIVDEFAPYEAHVYRYRKLGGRAIRSASAFRVEAFPNPSAGPVRAVLDLAHAAAVDVVVVDSGGRRVAVAASGRYDAGTAEISWDGRDTSGSRVASGVYFLRAAASTGETATARVVMTRR
jgi:hypothetical protein